MSLTQLDYYVFKSGQWVKNAGFPSSGGGTPSPSSGNRIVFSDVAPDGSSKGAYFFNAESLTLYQSADGLTYMSLGKALYQDKPTASGYTVSPQGGAVSKDGKQVGLATVAERDPDTSDTDPTPEKGDLWLVSNLELFSYNGTAWQDDGSIKGQQGQAGNDGEKGADGKSLTGLDITFTPAEPKAGEPVSLTLTPSIDNQPQKAITGIIPAGAQGVKGADGKDGLNGKTVSKVSLTETPIRPGQPATVAFELLAEDGTVLAPAAFDTTVGLSKEGKLYD